MTSSGDYSRIAETARQERTQGQQPQARESGDPSTTAVKNGKHPENQRGAAQATEDNDLTTGHSSPSDGGADNAKRSGA
jgi:hypothetical protein